MPLLTAAGAAGEEALPCGFTNIELGAELETVKKNLSENQWFAYRGEPDFSLLAETEKSLIRSKGNSFIDEGYFQFYNGRLYIITIVLNKSKTDYFTFYSRFSEKYGKPSSMDPSAAYWEDDKVSLVLEKPLNIKYIDKKISSGLKGKRETAANADAEKRKEFISLF